MDKKAYKIIKEMNKVRHRRIKIFLVDDDIIYLKSMMFYLKKHFGNSAEVKSFSSFDKIRDAMHEQPDLIVADYMLDLDHPSKNGLTLLKGITKDLPLTKIILISGKEDHNVIIRALKLGAFTFLHKSSDTLRKLVSTIDLALNTLIKELMEFDYQRFVLRLKVMILAVFSLTVTAKLLFPHFFD